MEKVVDAGLEILTKYKSVLEQYQINTPLRQAYFLATIATESGCKPISENLNYSAERLVGVFKKYFPTIEIAREFEKKPQKIANKVYSNKFGNGSEASGDGWKYRGRGFIQITLKANYIALSNYTKIDFVSNPDMLLQEEYSVLSACWYWLGHKCNNYADADNPVKVRQLVNGGKIGLDKFKLYLVAFKNKLL